MGVLSFFVFLLVGKALLLVVNPKQLRFVLYQFSYQPAEDQNNNQQKSTLFNLRMSINWYER
jgi:hypothetical protein